jgi:integrase
VIEPKLHGEPDAMPELTLADLVELYLDRHSVTRRKRTIDTLRQRLRYATDVYGDAKLHDLKNSRREVPLTGRALAALDRLPPRLDTPLLFPAPEGGPLNLDNFRNREWTPAVEAAGVQAPATPYDMRDTFASNALAAGVTVFELAKVMGTSVRMIERHYGALLEGAHAGITGRLDALEAELEQTSDDTKEAQP